MSLGMGIEFCVLGGSRSVQFVLDDLFCKSGWVGGRPC